MRKISIYFDGSLYIWRWLQPLYWARDELRERGYVIEFFNNPFIQVIKSILNIKINYEEEMKSICNKDIVFLPFHHMSGFCLEEKEKRIQILKQIKSNCKTVVWLDCSDSTGTSMFDVLPYVDLYLKKQLLHDRNEYLKSFYGNRKYVDYYVKKFALEIPKNENCVDYVENKDLLSKLDISWNVALWNVKYSSKLDILKTIFGFHTFNKRFVCNPSINRNLKMFFNGQVSKESTAITFQRRMTLDLIRDFDSHEIYAPEDRISHNDYVHFMKNTICSVSPFGYGEICNRDFETFMFGGCLCKPQMNHLDTFPNLYIENVTYIPINWDFSNFKDIIGSLIKSENLDKFYNIALNGQNKYLEFACSEQSKSYLADHIISVLKTHQC